ncbi:hypothetical protein AB0D46_04340 [Streptomyces sp. NPDC048383]|uniref:hypothetical protein n=1 Tax=Streptomyces sp. NPDC048383 TaxID=3155386 RepID=UPI00343007C1
MSEYSEVVRSTILDAAEQTLRRTSFYIKPQVWMLCEDMEQPVAGYLTCRDFRRGADAAKAIGDLGLFPSQLAATRLIVAWEDADLRTALELPGEPYAHAYVTLEASFTDHVLHWHPFEQEETDIPNEFRFPTVIPHWGTPARYENVPLLPPVQHLLDVWRELRGGDMWETARAQEGSGYRLVMFER